jgi:hypothetical protein
MSKNGQSQEQKVLVNLYYSLNQRVRDLAGASGLQGIPRPSIRRALHQLVVAGKAAKTETGYYRV